MKFGTVRSDQDTYDWPRRILWEVELLKIWPTLFIDIPVYNVQVANKNQK